MLCATCGQTVERGPKARFCRQCGEPLKTAGPAPVVLLHGVCKSLGGNRVLNQLSLGVPAGESLVIVGLSGSGKSVLLEHLVGFQRADAGLVQVNGRQVSPSSSEDDLRRLRQDVGLVFQGSALLDALTVEENIELPLLQRGVASDAARQEAGQLLAAVGLSPSDAALVPAQLSGGMQKRVAIARALIGRPQLLLYDEPTTGLDAASSTRISRLMRQVQQNDPQLTCITITHDYRSAAYIADRVLYLDQEHGSLVEVLGREALEEIRARQGDGTPEAIAAIRAHLEQYFEQREFRERLAAARKETGWARALGNVLGAAFHGLGAAALLAPKVLLPTASPALGRRLFEIGFQSLLVVSATGAVVGAMLAVQVGQGLARHQVPNLQPLPGIVGHAMIEKIGPLVLGLLLAGRVGASVSAEIGGYRLSRQFDALRAMAVSPERYWLAPIFWACILALPVLAIALEAAAIAGAYAVAVMLYGMNSSAFLQHVLRDVSVAGFGFGLLRTALFGATVSLVGYAHGAEEKRTSQAVGRATTEAVVTASLGVIFLEFLLTLVVR